MPPRVYPCLCGYMCERYPQMRYHRRSCDVWQNRPDPKALSSRRRSSLPKKKRAKRKKKRAKRKKCSECHQRTDSHAKGCSNSLEVRTRRELLERHGVDPEVFAVLLFLLAKRYADKKLDE